MTYESSYSPEREEADNELGAFLEKKTIEPQAPYEESTPEPEPVKKKKTAKKKTVKKEEKKEEPLLEGQVIGGGFDTTRYLHTKDGKLAKFGALRDAIIASKRYGGKARPEDNGFIVKK
jgi:hypothetical protein